MFNLQRSHHKPFCAPLSLHLTNVEHDKIDIFGRAVALGELTCQKNFYLQGVSLSQVTSRHHLLNKLLLEDVELTVNSFYYNHDHVQGVNNKMDHFSLVRASLTTSRLLAL